MDIYRKFITNRPEHVLLYDEIMTILETDKDFEKSYGRDGNLYRSDAMYIKHFDIMPTKGKYKPLKEQLKNNDKISIYHRYIETAVNLEYDNLREAIENKNYVKNECWINAITDNYKDTLLAKKRNPITRETI